MPSFLSHLEALRWHLLRAVVAVGVAMVLGFVFMDFLFNEVILGPIKPDFLTNRLICRINPDICIAELAGRLKLQFIGPMEQFSQLIRVGIISGIILAFPYLAWEVWRFVKPGLHPNERKRSRFAVVWVSVLFLTGAAFAYLVVTPFALSFLATLDTVEGAEDNWRVGQVVAFVTQLTLVGGVLFELPVLVAVASQLGFVTPQLMRKYRRHAVVAILLVAAIITPSPDAFSQLMLGLPMLGLYEASIFVSARIYRRRLARGEAKEFQVADNYELPQLS